MEDLTTSVKQEENTIFLLEDTLVAIVRTERRDSEQCVWELLKKV